MNCVPYKRKKGQVKFFVWYMKKPVYFQNNRYGTCTQAPRLNEQAIKPTKISSL